MKEFDESPFSSIEFKRCKFCEREPTKNGWFWCSIMDEESKSKMRFISPCTEVQYKLCPVAEERAKMDAMSGI